MFAYPMRQDDAGFEHGLVARRRDGVANLLQALVDGFLAAAIVLVKEVYERFRPGLLQHLNGRARQNPKTT